MNITERMIKVFYCKAADDAEIFDNFKDLREYVNTIVLEQGITDVEISDDDGRAYEIELELIGRN